MKITMHTPLIALRLAGAALALAAVAAAQEPAAADGTIDRLSRQASEQLEKSTHELDALNDEITAEKLPLSQELTALEEKVTGLRREYERVSRQVDAGALEGAGLEAEKKLRQDELTYVGSLLDDYAHALETKVDVSELQYCGTAIETAKQATENTTLSMEDRFARQADLVDVSLKRLSDLIGGMTFPGVGVDPQGAVVEGTFALIGPVALFRAASGVAGLVMPQTGSTKPLIRPLEGALQVGLASLVQSGDGLLPLDPSRGGALKALIQRTSLIHIFQKGGPIMWPLLVASILALGTVLERLLFLANERRKRDPDALERLFSEVQRGDYAAAIRTSKTSKYFVVRTLVYALEHREKSLANAIVHAQANELKRFRRGIPVLDTIITLAPLLGLLGTVTGMMGSFSLIGGELSAPGAITGGIAEALIATAFGLGIAITSLLPFNFLNARLDEARHEIESASTQLELMVHPQPEGHAVLHPNSAPATHAVPAPHARQLVAQE